MNVYKQKRFGFSLVEVNLAVFVVASGLLVIFVLFPLGLKESEMSVEDTHEAMFAEYVLGTIEGNAMGITDPAVWKDMTTAGFLRRTPGGALFGLPPDIIVWDYLPNPNYSMIFPAVGGSELKYLLIITNYPSTFPIADKSWERKRISLTAKSGKYGKVTDGRCYVSEVFFGGM